MGKALGQQLSRSRIPWETFPSLLVVWKAVACSGTISRGQEGMEEHQGLSHLGTGAGRNETAHNPGGIAHSIRERNSKIRGNWHLLQTPS